MFFEIETGKIVDKTALASLHCADDNIHFWHGPFMYSFSECRNAFRFALCLFYYGKQDAYKCEKAAFLFEQTDDDQIIIFIDSGVSRFGFSIDPKHILALINYFFRN